MKCLFILLLTQLMVLAQVQGQSIERSVISGLGQEFNSPEIQGSATIGESVTSTLSEGNLVITQGFHQANSGLITGLDQLTDISHEIIVYPNPAQDIVNLEINTEGRSYHYELFTQDGRRLSSNQPIFQYSGQSQLDFSPFSTGQYHLRITSDDGRYSGLITIIKIR